MQSPSIRARLTAWYVAALAAMAFTLAGASWWLSTNSVISAADVGLAARIQGVRDFLENPRTDLTVNHLLDEFAEYAELTRGEALLEVIDANGQVLCRPSIPGWIEMSARATLEATSGKTVSTDRLLNSLPFRVASANLVAHGATYRVTVAAPMGPAYQALNRFHRLLLVLFPAAVIAAAFGGYWISTRALAPVDEITRAVQAITVQHLDQRLPLPAADDELRRLAVTFNDVLGRLQLAVGDIVRFTADASHELRTPVALIQTTSELALRHPRTDNEYRTALTEIVGQSRHMSELVNDLLVLARTDAGIEPRDEFRLELGAVVREAAREAAEVATALSSTVSVTTPERSVTVSGDRLALRRLLSILLDNAVRYSSPGGAVQVRMALSDNGAAHSSVAIEVADDGIGIEPIEMPRVFERFYRGSRAREHTADGTGLGLAIARTIVERHDGSIALVPSTDLPGGRGCIVRVVLPLEARQSLTPRSPR